MSASCRIPRLLLFDIDCTLIRSRHPPKSNAKTGGYLMTALSRAFAKPVDIEDGIVYSGGTDGSLARELLQINGITHNNCEKYSDNIKTALDIMPEIVETRVANGQLSWYSLPNVNELLQKLVARTDVKLAILTGNVHDIAVLKLKSAGINAELFKEKGQLFGAFGCDHFIRDELVKIAKRRYCDFLGCGVEPNDMVIIGDSPKDISCAHNNNVPCVAVDTGFYEYKQLSHADCVLVGGFKDIECSVKALTETMRSN